MQLPVMPSQRRSTLVFRHFGAAAIAGALLGGVSAAVTAHGLARANPLVAFWCGAGLLALVTTPLGLVSFGTCWALPRLLGASRQARWQAALRELGSGAEQRVQAHA